LAKLRKTVAVAGAALTLDAARAGATTVDVGLAAVLHGVAAIGRGAERPGTDPALAVAGGRAALVASARAAAAAAVDVGLVAVFDPVGARRHDAQAGDAA